MVCSFTLDFYSCYFTYEEVDTVPQYILLKEEEHFKCILFFLEVYALSQTLTFLIIFCTGCRY